MKAISVLNEIQYVARDWTSSIAVLATQYFILEVPELGIVGLILDFF